ncbi:bifunctional 5,10-methylene-tetrahydrofolate dehydrogenase/5,10-methylene-tetrahydrofolate cyclohydrolase [bacterium]|nr:bifunctional 5,10-methylene-tetrahydrofolate dehydrogenase/5,10-methylene-tetrahydrofolate cyclohydrolase [bacterium]MBU1985322.1 bifunctional 5,10-methylene-tetrahydrofolate dehydrogenase/5,10-methylene-tetrahydrofolate cyclohydrolase [bacterium]
MAELIDGRAIAGIIRGEIENDIRLLHEQRGAFPGLAVVLVGDNPASKMYVSAKAKMCEKLGIRSTVETMRAESNEQDLLRFIDRLNQDPSIHGILVQLPLPPQINSQEVIRRIDPQKDVDGLHPHNVGLLCTGQPHFIPCTPYGICELLIRSGVAITGREVVVLGRSNLVGRPLSILLSSKGRYGNATVTVCHSRSANLPEICRRADTLVVAIGRRKFVTGDMVKPGAVVIDVGSHPPSNALEKTCGDVDFESASPVASKITPVPGGVGPMTIAMLMRNATDAAARQCGLDLSHAS